MLTRPLRDRLAAAAAYSAVITVLFGFAVAIALATALACAPLMWDRVRPEEAVVGPGGAKLQTAALEAVFGIPVAHGYLYQDRERSCFLLEEDLSTVNMLDPGPRVAVQRYNPNYFAAEVVYEPINCVDKRFSARHGKYHAVYIGAVFSACAGIVLGITALGLLWAFCRSWCTTASPCACCCCSRAPPRMYGPGEKQLPAGVAAS